MQPETLSASAAETYENCPARFHAENILKAPQPGGAAAALGTATHGALERFIVDELYLSGGTLADLHALFEEEWWKEFSEKIPNLYDDGKDMLETWFERNDFKGRTVLMAEIKERFPLEVNGVTIRLK